MKRQAWHARKGRTALAANLTLVMALTGAVAAQRPAAPQPLKATITVNTAKTLATVPTTAVGVNTAVWDPYLMDPSVPGLLQRANTQMLRYPGGSTADVYHWQTNTTTDAGGGQAGPDNNFDNFMTQLAQPAHAQVVVTVNYGSDAAGTGGGSPDEAAGWVRAANITHHYGVQYWEIGNEIYGNGYYGARWETDLHADHSPTAYGNNALTYIHAMKAVDPTIKVGLVLAAAGAWPDGQGPQPWNSTVLGIACSAADFVSVHWYAQNPGHESDPGLLSSVSFIPRSMRTLRTLMAQKCGARGAQMPVMLTETNSVSSAPGKQTLSPINGLFLIEDYLQWLQAGVANVDWWTLHNGASFGNASHKLIGTSPFGDYGLLAYQGTPAPYPSYTALGLVGPLLVPGATLTAVKSSVSTLHAYAVKSPSGATTVVVVNGSPTHAYRLKLRTTGGATPSTVPVTTYGATTPHPKSGAASLAHGYVLPPYTAALLQLAA